MKLVQVKAENMKLVAANVMFFGIEIALSIRPIEQCKCINTINPFFLELPNVQD